MRFKRLQCAGLVAVRKVLIYIYLVLNTSLSSILVDVIIAI